MTYATGVGKFAALMRERMRANGHKHGWESLRTDTAWFRAMEEMAELGQALGSKDHDRIRREAADVGNFLMMLCLSLEEKTHE